MLVLAFLKEQMGGFRHMKRYLAVIQSESFLIKIFLTTELGDKVNILQKLQHTLIST